MTETAYETLPELESSETRIGASTVVMKFGGTSVADPEKIRRVASRLVGARSGPGRGSSAVVSAMGYHTDELLELAHAGLAAAEAARAGHAASRSASASRARSSRWRSPTSGTTRSRSRARRPGSSPTPCTGRRRSSRCARTASTRRSTQERIVLVAGFQGVSTDYDVTTLGRGGSDTTAVALAAALGADACEIYTDVDGVFTADPRVVPDAQKLHAVSYEEMLEMAASGAKVLQLRSVEFARNHGVMLHVRSTFTERAGHVDHGGGRADAREGDDLGRHAHARGGRVPVDGVRPADLFDALADA